MGEVLVIYYKEMPFRQILMDWFISRRESPRTDFPKL